jgi:hypothetical protein
MVSFKKKQQKIKQKMTGAGFTKLQKNLSHVAPNKKQIFEHESLKLQKTFYLCNAFSKREPKGG